MRSEQQPGCCEGERDRGGVERDYGSEPHMPFGGFKQSGNGTREPGTEALDVYSELKDIYLLVDPAQV